MIKQVEKKPQKMRPAVLERPYFFPHSFPLQRGIIAVITGELTSDFTSK